MAGKFEVYRDKAGKFRFRLKAANGQIIATGEAYESKSAVMNGIESIRSNAMAAALVDLSDASTPSPASMKPKAEGMKPNTQTMKPNAQAMQPTPGTMQPTPGAMKPTPAAMKH